jgi:hypothetical protein
MIRTQPLDRARRHGLPASLRVMKGAGSDNREGVRNGDAPTRGSPREGVTQSVRARGSRGFLVGVMYIANRCLARLSLVICR